MEKKKKQEPSELVSRALAFLARACVCFVLVLGMRAHVITSVFVEASCQAVWRVGRRQPKQAWFIVPVNILAGYEYWFTWGSVQRQMMLLDERAINGGLNLGRAARVQCRSYVTGK